MLRASTNKDILMLALPDSDAMSSLFTIKKWLKCMNGAFAGASKNCSIVVIVRTTLSSSMYQNALDLVRRVLFAISSARAFAAAAEEPTLPSSLLVLLCRSTRQIGCIGVIVKYGSYYVILGNVHKIPFNEAQCFSTTSCIS